MFGQFKTTARVITIELEAGRVRRVRRVLDANEKLAEHALEGDEFR
jgi:hypothetical protein